MSPPRIASWIANTRRGVDRDTCGQAAVATVLRAHDLAALPPSDGEAIDAVRAEFPPDLPFALGTSAFRVAAALRRHGLEVDVVSSGWFGRRRDEARQRLRAHLEHGLPAPVCLDGRAIGASRWSAHWAVALGLAPAEILLGNAEPAAWPWTRFEEVWACRHLPYPHNHCAVLARRPARAQPGS